MIWVRHDDGLDIGLRIDRPRDVELRKSGVEACWIFLLHLDADAFAVGVFVD